MTSATVDASLPLDTPEARERSVRRLLESRDGLKVEARFDDAGGGNHEVLSCPVAGGRYLYDSSVAWGLRALGFCRVDDAKHMKAVCDDYTQRCAAEVTPVCRALLLSDILRRRVVDDEDEGGS